MFKAVLICLILIPWIAIHGQEYVAPNQKLISFSQDPSTFGDPQPFLGGSARFHSTTGPGLTRHVFEPHISQHFGRGYDSARGSPPTGRQRSQRKLSGRHFEFDENNGNFGIFKTSSRTPRTRAFGIGGGRNQIGVGNSLRSASRTSATAGVSASARILRQERQESEDGSYLAVFETEDGLTWEEQGAPLGPGGAIVKKGSYTFTFPDGTPGQVRYIADENGFRPESNLIPAAPAHALVQVTKAQEERSFGVVDDGRYREEDHRSYKGLRDLQPLNGNTRALTESRTIGGLFPNQFAANSRNNHSSISRNHQGRNFGAQTSQNTGSWF